MNKSIRDQVIAILIAQLIIWSPSIIAIFKSKISNSSYNDSLATFENWFYNFLGLNLRGFTWAFSIAALTFFAIYIVHAHLSSPVKWDFHNNFLIIGGDHEKGSLVSRVRLFNCEVKNKGNVPVTDFSGFIYINSTGEKFALKLVQRGDVVDTEKLLALPPKHHMYVHGYFSKGITDHSAYKGHLVDDFLNRFVPFSLVANVNSKKYRFKFTEKSIKSVIKKQMEQMVPPRDEGPLFND